MGICFLCGERYADFIRRNTTRFAEGDIVDIDGNIVGRHAGLPFYTIGQKRGEGIPAGSCIVAVDPQRNRIVAGRDEDLYRKTVVIGHCNIVDRSELRAADITAKIRGIGRNPQLPVAVTALGEGLQSLFRGRGMGTRRRAAAGAVSGRQSHRRRHNHKFLEYNPLSSEFSKRAF